MRPRSTPRKLSIPIRLAPAAMRELVMAASTASRAGQQLGPMELARLSNAISARLAERAGACWWRRLVGA